MKKNFLSFVNDKRGVVRATTNNKETATFLAERFSGSYRLLSDGRRYEVYARKASSWRIYDGNLRITHCKNGAVMLTGNREEVEKAREMASAGKNWFVKSLGEYRVKLPIRETHYLK